MRTYILLCAAVLSQVACSSNGGADGGPDGVSNGDVATDGARDAIADREDASALPDAGDVIVASDVPSDTACSALLPCLSPPAGFTLCGGGAIDVSAAMAACTSLDPPMDIGIGAMVNCGAFTLIHGSYSVYCGSSSVYFWVDYDMVSSTDVNPCDISATLPDGAVVTGSDPTLAWDARINSVVYARYGVGSGMNGGMLEGVHSGSSDMQTAMRSSTWQGMLAFEGTGVATGASGDTVRGALYFEANPVDCEDVPTGQGAIVAATPVMWVVP